MSIYNELSIDNLIRENATIDKVYSEKGGIVKVPPVSLVKDAIYNENCSFTVGFSEEDVCGFIWGEYNFLSSGVLFDAFCRSGINHEAYNDLITGLSENITSYGADLMISSKYAKSGLAHTLYKHFLETLVAKHKRQLVYMVEHITSIANSSKTLCLNLKNNASINLHKTMGARILKRIDDVIEIATDSKVGRCCEYYLLNIETALKVLNHRLDNCRSVHNSNGFNSQ